MSSGRAECVRTAPFAGSQVKRAPKLSYSADDATPVKLTGRYAVR